MTCYLKGLGVCCEEDQAREVAVPIIHGKKFAYSSIHMFEYGVHTKHTKRSAEYVSEFLVN